MRQIITNRLQSLAQELKLDDAALIPTIIEDPESLNQNDDDDDDDDDEHPNAASDIPLSRPGSLFILVSALASHYLSQSDNSHPWPFFTIFPDHHRVVQVFLGSNEDDMASIGRESGPLADAVIALGLWAYEQGPLGSIEQIESEELNTYLQVCIRPFSSTLPSLPSIPKPANTGIKETIPPFSSTSIPLHPRSFSHPEFSHLACPSFRRNAILHHPRYARALSPCQSKSQRSRMVQRRDFDSESTPIEHFPFTVTHNIHISLHQPKYAADHYPINLRRSKISRVRQQPLPTTKTRRDRRQHRTPRSP